MAILDNLKKIRYRIRTSAEKSGRDPESIKLLAVTKYAELEAVKELLNCGLVSDIGENRVQEAQSKRAALGQGAGGVCWRLIGHLQTNKAKQALRCFDAVDSLDSLKLARVLEKLLAAEDRTLPVLIQLKLSERTSQFGIAPEDLAALLEGLKECPHLSARGLMTIAPALEPVEGVRPCFKEMRRLFDKFFSGRPDAQLSMGMSRDFEIAVEEGATLVRIGSALFS